MKKTVILCLVSYISGILLFEACNISALVFVCLFLLITVCIKNFAFKNKSGHLSIIMCLFFIVGACYTAGINYFKTADINKALGDKAYIEGRIVKDALVNNEYYDYYEIDVYKLKTDSFQKQFKRPLRLKLSLKKYKLKNSYTEYKYGDVIEILAQVSGISLPLNPGEIDYNKINKADGLFASVTSSYDNSKFIESKINYLSIYDLSYIARSYCKKLIDTYFSGDEASLLKGILLSEKDFGDEYYESLLSTGMVHITVASGLHTSCLFTIMTFLLFSLRIKKGITYSITAMFLWAFAFMQGLTPSIIRAVIMFSFYMLSLLVGRDYDKGHILFVTAFIMLLKNPYILFDLGFILSFTSVLGIALFFDAIDGFVSKVIPIRRLSAVISVSIAVQITIFPLLSHYFNRVSVYGVLTNLLIVPIITPILAFGFIFVLAGKIGTIIPRGIAYILNLFLKYINIVIKYVSKIPFSSIDIFFADSSFVIIYYLLMACIYCRFIKRNKKCAKVLAWICALFSICIVASTVYINLFMQVHFINVGQGDGALIKLPYGKTVVIDGGGSSPKSKTDVGEKIFVPYVRRNSGNVVDYMILSHYDKDHAQGIATALDLMKIKNLVLPYRENADNEEYKKIIEKTATQKGINVLYLKEGDRFVFGGAVFEIFAPTYQNAVNRVISENEKSLVVKMSYGQTSFLFTGDVSGQALGKLTRYGDKLESNVIKISHHGSEESNPTKLIRSTNPDYAVISVGENNIYDLPDEYVLRLLQKENVRTYRTDENGTIIFFADKNKIRLIKTFYKLSYR